jgi:hypothetical protein
MPAFANTFPLGAINKMTSEIKYIESVIDKAIDFSAKRFRLQAPEIWVPDYMVDKTRNSSSEGIVFWKPCSAKNVELDFPVFEQSIGYQLPGTYKAFLSYLYFIELNFAHDVDFFRHTTSWMNDYFEQHTEGIIEDTIECGYIPFARENDQGYFCFDTTRLQANCDYPIVKYDSSFGIMEYPSIGAKITFLELMRELDKSLEQWALTMQNGA